VDGSESARLRGRIEALEAGVSSLSLHGIGGFLEFAAERFSDALYWIAEDGSILYANQTASRMLGYTPAELCALKMYELNLDLDPASWSGMWGLLKASGSRRFEARHRRRDGRVFLVEVEAHFCCVDGEEYSCAFVRDVSERRELEQRLRQAEKMEAIGRLAGGIAHDFNNQLTGIMGYADLLRRASTDNQKAQRLVDQLSQAVKVAGELTGKLLAFSRQGNLVSEPVDLHRLIEDVVTMLSHSIDRRIQIETTLGAERFWTLGDPSQLQSSLLNLLLNARDAMPHGGTVTISTANVEFEAASSVPGPFELAPGTYVKIDVRDTGVGMDAETRARIFEPFFTTKEVGAGTGLGLSAVYGTVKSHKGAVSVDSTVGGGSCFTLYLPASRPGSVALLPTEEPASLRLRGHVVVIDDEPAVRDVQVQMLEALGCVVTTFEDPERAIEFFRAQKDGIDLVLLDLVMPGKSGEEVFYALRQIEPRMPVLIVSGYSVGGQAQRILEAGAKGLLQKPFTMASLAAKVSSLLRP
jgi:two-component system cell cycle sensor histidine kinase/response regulator CckA